MAVSGPLKWHGGKAYLASRFIALFPPHFHYVEPYFGGGAVLLAKNPEGISEVVNDLSRELTGFWRVLQGDESYCQFRRIIEAMPFSEAEWKDADGDLPYHHAGEVGDAVRFFVRCRQSLAGRCQSFTAITKTRTRRGMSNDVSAWLTAVDGLSAVHARLRRVLILDARPALEVIAGQDGPKTLFYCDPPYLHSTRSTTKEYGLHEMSEEDHFALLCRLDDCKGKVALSGYRSHLYDRLLFDWTRHDFDTPNHAAGGATKRTMTECLWVKE